MFVKDVDGEKEERVLSLKVQDRLGGWQTLRQVEFNVT